MGFEHVRHIFANNILLNMHICLTDSVMKLKYEEIAKALSRKNQSICYDNRRCKDPVCRTLVKALFEAGQKDGWMLTWGLQVIAFADLTFEELIRRVTCGNFIEAIRAAVGGWEVDDDDDFRHAMHIHETLNEMHSYEEEPDEDGFSYERRPPPVLVADEV
jgi:hypothetical protein